MIDYVTLGVFVFVMSLVWLGARLLLKPRAAVSIGPQSSGASAIMSAEDQGGGFAAGLATPLPATLFDREELDRDFRRAGYYLLSQRQRFLALRNGFVIFAVLASVSAAAAVGMEHEQAFWTILIGGFITAVVGYSLPRVLLGIRARQRVERIRDGLPDAMDTITMCLQGGISLQECLGYVGQELVSVHPDLAFELFMVERQAEINSFEFAIQQFAWRIDAPEVIALAALVSQNQKLGTSIVESMREFADNLRLKRRQTAEAQASRTELFLLFPVIFCLVPSILLLLWGPPILSLIDFLHGHVGSVSVVP